MKWGLIPFWEKTAEKANEIRKLTYNAKADTVFEKPSFREPIKKHRCLVPSTGFFEWHHNSDGTKMPYFIRLKDGDIFSMAGIYDEWRNPETGKILRTFSILTTEANQLLAKMHNAKKRMPVILSAANKLYWLQPNLSKEEDSSYSYRLMSSKCKHGRLIATFRILSILGNENREGLTPIA